MKNSINIYDYFEKVQNFDVDNFDDRIDAKMEILK